MAALAPRARATPPTGQDAHDRARAGRSFARFWNAEAGYCYDVVDGPAGDDAALRPNQIFALSLPTTRSSRRAAAPARRRVRAAACSSPYGLRTLAPADPGYQRHYGGGPRERDGAYHQGTAWAWLLGPFAMANDRVTAIAPRRARCWSRCAAPADDGVGSISEIFDGEAPFAPRGCLAQAWCVAEALRAWRQLDPKT